MPWKETCPMDERMKFISDYLKDGWSVTHLCSVYGISRKTGHKWIARYEDAGWGGLAEQSRTPKSHPAATSPVIRERLVQFRLQHPHWGPRKMIHRLTQLEPAIPWPAPSTAGDILKRQGLVAARRHRSRTPHAAQPLSPIDGPNAVWGADFKGWIRTGDRTRLDPLTLSDLASRYLLRCQGLRAPTGAQVQPVFLSAFREFGLPTVIRTDNGPPFASTGLGGLSRLAVWWIRLGIHPERIQPGHPEQNGRHERLHRTLKAATLRPPRVSPRRQQQAFEQFRLEYNQQRPHEALQMQTPAQCYRPSGRPYPRRLPEVAYPAAYEVRRVRSNGEIKWQGRHLFLSEALIGEPVGLLHMADDLWRLEFGPIPLALYHSHSQHLERV